MFWLCLLKIIIFYDLIILRLLEDPRKNTAIVIVQVNLKSTKSIRWTWKQKEKKSALVLFLLCGHTVYAGDGKRRVRRGFAAENLETIHEKIFLS